MMEGIMHKVTILPMDFRKWSVSAADQYLGSVKFSCGYSPFKRDVEVVTIYDGKPVRLQ